MTIRGFAEAPLAVQLLGPLEVRVCGAPLPPLRSRRGFWLLALLALRHGQQVERDWLAGALWPESAPAQAFHNLRVTLSDLRRALGPQAFRLRSPTRHTLCLDLTGAAVDVGAFDAAIQRSDEASLERAVGLYRGPLLEGCTEEWAFQERQCREQAYLSALEQLAGLAQMRGAAAEAERYLRMVVAVDPLRESAQRALMKVLAAGGSYAAALLVYRGLRLRLHQEVNAEPDPETRALFERVQAQARGEGSAGHQSPDASKVEGDGAPIAGPPPGSLAVGGSGNGRSGQASVTIREAFAVPHNLPLHLTLFFGRETEMAQLCEALGPRPGAADTHNPSERRGPTADSRRLVTLTGPGGSGKTRLALEVARALRQEFQGAVCFVALVDLTDPRLLPEPIRDALGLARTPDVEPLEQVVGFLSSRAGEAPPFLLVLDNFEQLLPAMPELGEPGTNGGAAVVWRLLERVDHLRVLVTSRQRLGLPGEREFPVAPLSVPHEAGTRGAGDGSDKGGPAGLYNLHPTPCTLSQFPSVALFVDRAQAVQPDFRLTARNAASVAALCQRLEGLPLAIELAAARARVLTPEQMLARLEQRFELLAGRQRSADPRHRSLRAALDWSYRLLTPELQQFFARLSVFRGGWTLEAAAAVCEEPSALEYLERLRECSLVLADETAREMRFHLLESVREYGREQLSEDERGALARRHAGFFLALAETAERELVQEDQRHWLDRLEREHDNLRAALAWANRGGEIEHGLRLGSALEEFWCRRGYLTEGREQLLRLLAHPGAAAPTAVRAQALSVAGRLAGLQTYSCNLQPPRRLHAESLAIWRALGDRAGICRALFLMALEECEPATARALAEECLAIRRELGEPRGIAEALQCLAGIQRQAHDLPAARALVEESLAIWRAVNDRAGIQIALGILGGLALDQGDMSRARRLFEESLALARELDDRTGIAWGLTRLGYVAHGQEEYAAARALFEQALPLWRELEQNDGLAETLFHLAHLRRQEADYPGAYTLIEELAAVMQEGNSVVTGPFALLGLAAADLGRWEEAAAYCGKRLRLYHAGDEVRHGHIVARSLTVMARVSLARGKAARAAQLLGSAAAMLPGSHVPWVPSERASFDRALLAVRAQLDEAEFAAAWAEGQAMPVEAVIAEALEEAPAG